MKVEMNLRI